MLRGRAGFTGDRPIWPRARHLNSLQNSLLPGIVISLKNFKVKLRNGPQSSNFEVGISMLPISSSLQKIAANLLQSTPANEAPLLAWPMACGSAVAGRTKALAFEDGVLTIAAPDQPWCTQLRGFSDTYLQTLNRICPTKISQLRFIIEKQDQSRAQI